MGKPRSDMNRVAVLTLLALALTVNVLAEPPSTHQTTTPADVASSETALTEASIADRVVPEEQFYDQALTEEISDGNQPLLLERAAGGGGRGRSGGRGRGGGRAPSRSSFTSQDGRRTINRDSHGKNKSAKGEGRDMIGGSCDDGAARTVPHFVQGRGLHIN